MKKKSMKEKISDKEFDLEYAQFIDSKKRRARNAVDEWEMYLENRDEFRSMIRGFRERLHREMEAEIEQAIKTGDAGFFRRFANYIEKPKLPCQIRTWLIDIHMDIGLPPYAVQDATAMSIKAQWERLGGGMARVRKYDSRRQGLEYTLKCLNVTNGGANLYEVGKFSHSADEVMLSNSICDPANLNRVSDTLVTA